ncbi:MAG: FHA domain-containing protein [Planctomycetota bacterium]
MHVTFRAIVGPMQGKEFVLRSAQLVKVGRTEWADIAFPIDDRMSSIHFAVETDLKTCSIKDLDSTNGTFLNSRRIKQRQVVGDGDEVMAGDTCFKVAIEGGDPDATDLRKTDTRNFPTPSAHPTAEIARRTEKPPAYTAEKCNSGLTLCRGEIADAPAADVALRLSEKSVAHLIVDFRRLGQAVPKDFDKVEYLFDWFEPDVAAVASPVLISQNDFVAWPLFLEDGWGKDAVVCLFSNQATAEVWSHLRRVCRAKGHGDAPPTAVLGFCWPSVLVALLSHHVAYSNQLFDGIDAILTEFPDLPDTWQLFGGLALPDRLDELGFEREQAEKNGRIA